MKTENKIISFCKKNKNEILKILSLIIIFAGVFGFVYYNIHKMPIWGNEKWARMIVIMFAFLLVEYSIFSKMKKGEAYFEILYKFLPAVIVIIVFTKLPIAMNLLPFLLPAIYILLFYKMLDAVVFQGFVILLYYYTDFMDADILLIYVIFYIFVYILATHVSSKNIKYIYLFLATIIGYVILAANYEYMMFDKIKLKPILMGIIPVIISIIPLYFKNILKDINAVYLRNSLVTLNDDENELQLILMNKNEDVYFHSLRVADVSVKVAKTMGANASLVNAAARFHEIGKLKSKDYINDGIKIMKENHFPREVIKIVKEHNSKTYKPKTMESAIVMLSDSIETTINQIVATKGNRFNRKKIAENIIDIRFDTGMLDYAVTDISQFKKLRKIYMDIYSVNEEEKDI